ncbi:MAG: RING-H2 finger protein [Candidatus Lokiarchaeota archaeon]|nr:RING-H2 finger protein [Candidatus Lokiarchaeota archaeon]
MNPFPQRLNLNNLEFFIIVMNEEKIQEIVILFWILIIWEIISSIIYFIPFTDIIEIPIDIVLIALCYSLYGPLSLILIVELVPFIDLLPLYFLFAVLVILKDDKKEKNIVIKDKKPPERAKKKTKFPTCIICLNEIKTETFICVCGSIFHKKCFLDFSTKQGCPICGKSLEIILKEKGI